jgi:hypothetical protein
VHNEDSVLSTARFIPWIEQHRQILMYLQHLGLQQKRRVCSLAMLSRSKYVIFLLHAFACLCAVQVIIWIGNYAYRHQETPVRNFNSVENKIDQIRYDGTPKMRRKLAEVGEEAVQNDMWIQMTKSIMEREKTIDKMYALHVSKSGGEFR